MILIPLYKLDILYHKTDQNFYDLQFSHDIPVATFGDLETSFKIIVVLQRHSAALLAISFQGIGRHVYLHL